MNGRDVLLDLVSLDKSLLDLIIWVKFLLAKISLANLLNAPCMSLRTGRRRRHSGLVYRKPNSDFETYRIVNSVCVLYLSHRLILSKKID